MRKWVPFFSRSGSEIANIIDRTGILPSHVVTNQPDIDKIDSRLLRSDLAIIHIPVSLKPTVNDYRHAIQHAPSDVIVTLNGWLRIIPPDICTSYEIYNLHPGLVTEYSGILKGKDPQQKAFDLKLPITGCTLHRVTAELDAGPIISETRVDISNLTTAEQVIKELGYLAVDQWLEFLSTQDI